MTKVPAKQIAIAVVQRAVADGGAEFLVGRRAADQSLAGCDEFPGGAIEAGELPNEAAMRECLEETGLVVQVLESLATVEHEYDFGRLRLFFFRCQLADDSMGVVAEPYRWVPRRRLDECDFPPANAAVVKLLTADREGEAPAEP